MTTERLNRATLTVGGILLTAAGGVVVAAGLGVFGSAVAQRPVLAHGVRRMFNEDGTWVWTWITACGAVAVLVGGFWLLSQLRTDRVGRLEIEPDRGRGYCQMSARALTDAVSGELRQAHGVEGVTARLVRRGRQSELRMALLLSRRADLSETRRRLESMALPHARESLAPDALPARVRLGLARRSGGRVR